MERKTTRRLICLAALWVPLNSHALGLWEACHLALRNDPAYQQQISLFKAARQRVPQARSALLPQIHAAAVHSRGYIETDRGDQPTATNSGASATGTEDVSVPPSRLGPPAATREDDYHATRASVTLAQPLFDRASSRALDSAQSQSEEASLQLANARQKLIVDTAEAYYDLLSARDTLETARLELKAVNTQRRLAERRYEEDLGTLTDVHESRARMELARVNMIDAENNQALARHRLEKV
ncbi:MAG TPA: TolC family protein, partial [Arenicellales bacterium]|nr:TolC family protein [Arenicellales bacterium]